uniref:Kunitz/Bovine pancreatic trypsin inhibitor domain protein n=1 Tax=Panagrellus redivivus TaxID=6233 RepID=A0A7E4ZVP5_PANRE
MRLLTTLCFTIFITFVASEELTTAIPVELEAKCKMPVDVGTGDGEIEERFFFDEPTQSCKAFNYTGAGGNENNFFSELECLNDCFIGVVNDHTKDQAEEDIVILSQNATQPLIDAAVEEWPCSKPKHNGDGKGAQQRFYYDDAYKTCFAFKYTGSGGNNNRFESHSECMSTCGLADGSVCSGPILSLEPLDKMAFECKDGVCPKGSHCARGMMVECCHKGQYDAVAAAFAETCPDGSAAGGVHTEYFQATFAKSCDDLICGKGEKCVQTSKDFAKCCGAGRRLADEVAVHVRLEGGQRLAAIERDPSRLFFLRD